MIQKVSKLAFFLMTSLAIILTGLWSSSGCLDVVDAGNRLRAATHLVEYGNFNIKELGNSESPPIFEDNKGKYGLYWNIGQILFFVPCVVTGKVLTLPIANNPGLLDKVSQVVISYMFIVSGLLANFWLSFLLARKITINRLYSYLLAIIATFGSSFWQITKQGQEEVQLSILLLAATLSYITWLESNKTKSKYLWLLFTVLAIAVLFRPTAITFVLGFGALVSYELWRKLKTFSLVEWSKELLPMVIMTAVSISVTCWFNYYKTGSILRTGAEHALARIHSPNWWHGFFESLCGSDKGIWITNLWLIPFLLASIFLFKKSDREWKQVFLLAWFLILSSSLLCSQLTIWAGDFTYGSRYQIHAISLLAIIMGTAFVRLLADTIKNQMSANITMLLITTSLVILQIPSIAFHCSLEIYQSIGTKGYPSIPSQTVTSQIGGQVPLRYKNFLAKLGTSKIIQFQNLKDEQKPLVEMNSRWNFLPYLSSKHLSPALAKYVELFFYLCILMSLGLWTAATRLAWHKPQSAKANQP